MEKKRLPEVTGKRILVRPRRSTEVSRVHFILGASIPNKGVTQNGVVGDKTCGSSMKEERERQREERKEERNG